MENTLNMLFVGVGGQGVLTASDIAAQVGLELGYDVKKSEIHGFAQRGGVVESHVRWAPKVFSPTCEKGTVDILLAFELLESVRWINWLTPDGTVIVNLQKVIPMSVITGNSSYPAQKDIVEELNRYAGKVIPLDAYSLAKKAESIRTTNVILLAALSEILKCEPTIWETAILHRIPVKYAEVNCTAFNLGRQAILAQTMGHPTVCKSG
jgi:indolepyruvate ferredoxin oxidoreductase beta subunit